MGEIAESNQVAALGAVLPATRRGVIDLGSRLELFIDDYLIERLRGTSLVLQSPTPREVAMNFTRPWEGPGCAYYTVLRDGDIVRLYYRGSTMKSRTVAAHEFACCAESQDGIRWARPKLDLCEFRGTTPNNIVWDGVGSQNFTPYRDTNPACPPSQRYKALGSKAKDALFAFVSPDGLSWKLLRRRPVIKGTLPNMFDSQNLAFWDEERGHYVMFLRCRRDGVRNIMVCTSSDFVNWTDPQWVDFGNAPSEELYTSATVPYFRAPHILMGFPMRFLQGRKKIAEHPYPGVSDSLFMTSRDGGKQWLRSREAFLRPGPMPERWSQRTNMMAWGILETAPELSSMPTELSLYSHENYATGPCRLRRHTLRIDGFVAVRAPSRGGELHTKALRFAGRELVINHATSAAGSVRVEIRDAADKPIPGYTLRDCPEIYGDEIEHSVNWQGGSDVSRLAGKAVRLRFVLKDADLFSIRFRG